MTIVDKMFCELDTCVTLTKNNIGSSEDSYREGLARGKFMQMKQEIQFVCVNKYPLALCEENHLLKMYVEIQTLGFEFEYFVLFHR